MDLIKKSFLAVAVSALALTFVLPLTTQALTYGEIVSGQQHPVGQGKVLGVMTPSPDINADGIVNSVDVAILLAHLGQNYPAADLNHDGAVNSLDFSILSSWYFAVK